MKIKSDEDEPSIIQSLNELLQKQTMMPHPHPHWHFHFHFQAKNKGTNNNRRQTRQFPLTVLFSCFFGALIAWRGFYAID